MSVDELYQELIIEHYKHPKRKGSLAKPDGSCVIHNPLCGDEVRLNLAAADGTISDIKFDGHGCAISQASTSIMADLCSGLTLDKAKQLSALFKDVIMGQASGELLKDFGDLPALEGVKRFPARLRCVLLGWEGLERCIRQVEEGGQLEALKKL